MKENRYSLSIISKKHYLCNMFHLDVNRFIEEKSLFFQKDKILVALSGGADSVALLRVLLALGYTCEAAHCNFHLRGKESDRDENFVRGLCNELNILLHVVHFDTQTYATKHRISIEMAAREMRYEWFEKLRQECDASVIAVAHHRDDSVETFLLNLIRGTGINGLKGIAPLNGHIVRPLLNVSRQNILQYLEHLHQDYVTDSTNLQDEYMRNKIRLNILPMLGELNPSVSESIAETANRLAETSLVYNKEMAEAKNRVIKRNGNNLKAIHVERLLTEVAPASLLFEILYPLGFKPLQIKDIFHSLSGQPGKRFISPEWEAVRDREYLLLQTRTIESTTDPTPQLCIKTLDLSDDFIIPKEKDVACLDADKVIRPLIIRKWQKGDKFVPFGMTGKKNVSDYLTDRKLSLFEKENQYVVCSDEKIIWLVGERSDNRFRITNTTKRVMIIRLQKER